MVNVLRENFIYSEKRARDFVFYALEAALDRASSAPVRPLLAKLTREVAAGARTAAEKSGYEFSTWDTTTKAVINSMLGAGVLLAEDGTPVRRDVRAQVTLSLFNDFENFTTFKPGPRQEAAVMAMLDDLIPWAKALRSMRALRP